MSTEAERKAKMRADNQVLRDQAKVRRLLKCFYPFDDVQIWLIDWEHLATFARYIPISKIPVDDIAWLRLWIADNK